MSMRALTSLAFALACGCADTVRDSRVDPAADPALTEPAALYLRFDLPADGALDLASPAQRRQALAGAIVRIEGHTHDGRPLARPLEAQIGEGGFDLDDEMFVVAHLPGGAFFVEVELPGAAFEPLDGRGVTLLPGERRSLAFTLVRRAVDFSGLVRRADNGPLPRDMRLDLGEVGESGGGRCVPDPAQVSAIEGDRRGRWHARARVPLGGEVCVRATAAGFAPASVVVRLPDHRVPAVGVPDLELVPQDVGVAVFGASPLDVRPFGGPEDGDPEVTARLVLLDVTVPPEMAFAADGCVAPPCADADVAVSGVAVSDTDADVGARQAVLVPLDGILDRDRDGMPDAVPWLGALSPDACADQDPASGYADALLDAADAIEPPLGAQGGRLRALYCLTAPGVGRRRLDVRLLGDDGVERSGDARFTFHVDAAPDLRVVLLDAVGPGRTRYVDGGDGGPTDVRLELRTTAASGWCARVAEAPPGGACDAVFEQSDAACEPGTERTVTLAGRALEADYAEVPARVCVRLSDRAGRTVTRAADLVRVMGRPLIEVGPGGLDGWRDRPCHLPEVERVGCMPLDRRRTDGLILARVVDSTDYGAGGAIPWPLRVEVADPGFGVFGALVHDLGDDFRMPGGEGDGRAMLLPIDPGVANGPREVRISVIDRLGRAIPIGPVEQGEDGSTRPIVFTVDNRRPVMAGLRLLDCEACRADEGRGGDDPRCLVDPCASCIDEGFFRDDGRALLPPGPLTVSLRTEQRLAPDQPPDAVCGVLRGAVDDERELCPELATTLQLGEVPGGGPDEIVEQQIGIQVFDRACLEGQAVILQYGRDTAAPTIEQAVDEPAGDIECLAFVNQCVDAVGSTIPTFRYSRDACLDGIDGLDGLDDTDGTDKPPLLGRLGLTVHDAGNVLLDVPVRYRVLAVEAGLDPHGVDWSGDGVVPLCSSEDEGRAPPCPAGDARCRCARAGVPLEVDVSEIEIWRDLRDLAVRGRERGERSRNPCEPGTAAITVELWLAVEDAVGNRALHAIDGGKQYRVFVPDPDADDSHREDYRRLRCPDGTLVSEPDGLPGFCAIEGRAR